MNKMIKYIGLVAVFCSGLNLNAQEIPVAIQEYIDNYYSIAVKEMNRTGIPASITLAQGIFESGFGKSRLAIDANNHFGIKCHKEWGGPTISEDDDAPGECFRVYSNPEESYVDHSQFLMTRDRYSSLFSLPSNDYINWAIGLKKAGYATLPSYADELIKRVNNYQLYRFDDPSFVYIPATKTQPVYTASTTPTAPGKTLPVTLVNNKEVNVAICYPNPNKPKQTICKIKTTYNNGLQATRSVNGDTPRDIATRAGVDVSDFCRYNECDPNWLLPEGTYMYFSNKTLKNKYASTYRIKDGDNLWLISQYYGIKESTLRKRNKLDSYEEPSAKQLISINKKGSAKPQVSSNPVRLPLYNPNIPVVPIVTVEKPATFKREEIVALHEAPEPKPIVKQPVAVVKEYEVIELPKEKPTTTVIPENKPIITTAAIQTSHANPIASTGLRTHYVSPKETLYGIARMYGTTIENIVEWNNLPDYNIQIGTTIIVGK